jgi:hypothetical protein
LSSNWDAGSIRRFCALRMGIGVLTMARGGNKGPRVISKSFEDLVHECGLKALERPSKRGL